MPTWGSLSEEEKGTFMPVSRVVKGETSSESVKTLSHVQLFVTLWSVACQSPLSMKFSRQEYCSGWPFSSPGNFPDLGIKPGSLALQADSLAPEPPGRPGKEGGGRKMIANQGFSTCCNCSNHYVGSKAEVPNLQAVGRYRSVVC